VPKQKKKKMQAVAPVQVSASELKNLLVEWLRNTPNASTRDCIHHFTPYLTDQEKKTEFSSLVREVAQLKGGVLVLRPKSLGTLPVPTSPVTVA
jgi:transcription initiation factor TFIIF subunit alpha